jgi:hypothetical protein
VASDSETENVHDIFRMPVHHSVLQVEAFDVSDCSRFNFFRKTKVTTELGHFREIVLHEQNFFVSS